MQRTENKTMKEHKRALWEYQQALTDAYYDMRMHSILDPL